MKIQTTAFLGIGANLIPQGYDSVHNALCDAVSKLAGKINIIAQSSWYATRPMPPSDQPDFLNGVLHIETDMGCGDLLSFIHNIEADFGRVRTVRNAARVLDIDILAYGQDIRNDPSLTIPHPRLSKRAFVLVPWAEIAPDWQHPISKKTVKELCDDLGDLNAHGIERRFTSTERSR